MSLQIIGLEISNRSIKKYKYDITKLDDYIINNISNNISTKYPSDNNLLIYGSLFGPNFNNTFYNDAIVLGETGTINNLFILSAGEKWCFPPADEAEFMSHMKVDRVIKIGNFDNIDPKLKFHFTWGVYSARTWGGEYITSDLILSNIKYKFINYNRDPKHYRVELVELIKAHDLDKYGIVTLGDKNCHNTMPLKEDLNEVTHCYDNYIKYNAGDVPNDNSSLGTMEYWNHHFLNVVSETFFYWWDDVFISEKTAKPIIGLRPFIINGNWKTYIWLEDNGFRTFEKYFPFAKFRDLHEDDIHPNIIKVIKWVCEQSNETLLELYNEMLPDLLHNRERMFEFANDEVKRIKNILL